MSGDGGPLAPAGLAGLPAAADALLERALDVLHAELASFVESHCILRASMAPGGEPLPDIATLDDADLAQFGELTSVVLDIEQHLKLPRAFSTAHSPFWLRAVLRRARQLREQTR